MGRMCVCVGGGEGAADRGQGVCVWGGGGGEVVKTD